jgi:hypothetical protein
VRFLVLIHPADDRPCSALSNGLDLKARTLNGPEFIASVGTCGAESGAEEWNRASADRRESRLSSHSLNHYRPRTITVRMRRRMALCGGFLRAWLLVAWLPPCPGRCRRHAGIFCSRRCAWFAVDDRHYWRRDATVSSARRYLS